MSELRVHVGERVLEAMAPFSEPLTLRRITDLANVDADFILGSGAIRARLDIMERQGLVARKATLPNTWQFLCHSDCYERAMCELAGKPGHTSCGTCNTHHLPSHHCGCPTT